MKAMLYKTLGAAGLWSCRAIPKHLLPAGDIYLNFRNKINLPCTKKQNVGCRAVIKD
jgi:hypothetical protein